MNTVHQYHCRIILLLSIFFFPPLADSASSIALGYTPKYAENFEHFAYVNPEAPKGGAVNMSAYGSFESLNPFLLKGQPAAGIFLLFDSLMESSQDEPFSMYGLLASDISIADDGLSVTFTLDKDARFSTGKPVTADDVKYSYDTLVSPAATPFYRNYWADVGKAVVQSKRKIKFVFKRANAELPMIMAQLPVFSPDWTGDKPFDQVVLDKPVGSGPYQIESVDLGKTISYVRNPDYWAKNKSIRKGMYNFDRITYKYYRDDTVMFEAFKAGEYDFHFENTSKRWATQYNGRQFDSGEIIKTTIHHQNNQGIQGFAFNIRKPIFRDRRVRQALNLSFDFEWVNANLFYGQYIRSNSYYSNSELAAPALPDEAELRLLKKHEKVLSPIAFLPKAPPPSTSPPGSLRANLRQASRLLKEAGWSVKDGVLVDDKGEPFEFEFILAQKAFEPVVAAWDQALKKLGIAMHYRMLDTAIFQQRADSFDFDMMVVGYGASQSPGNELRDMFYSGSANKNGSRNYIGIADPGIDAMIDEVIYAKDRRRLVTAAHALDRVLWAGTYLVPNWYIDYHRVAYWNKFDYPEHFPKYLANPPGYMLEAWWMKPHR